MREFEIDRAMSKLIAKLMDREWTPQEETAFKQLAAQRSRMMRPRIRR